MKYYLGFIFLFLYSNISWTQKFTLVADERKFLIRDGNTSSRQNCIESDGSIYYDVYDTKSNSSSLFDSYLARVNKDGSNATLLLKTQLRRTTFLAATDSYIYYTTSKESLHNTPEYMYLHRVNKRTGEAEAITTRKNDLISYDFGFMSNRPKTRLYAYQDKLVGIGRNNQGTKYLFIVTDKEPMAYGLSDAATEYSSNGFYTSESPAADEIAITDSLVYAFVKFNNKKVNGIRVFKIVDSLQNKSDIKSSFIDIDGNGFEAVGNKLVEANGKVYTILQKKAAVLKSDMSVTVSLYEFNVVAGKSLGNMELNCCNIFMKAFGNEIFVGDNKRLYKYDIASKKIVQILATKDYLSLLQNQDYLMRGNDGTIFAAIHQPLPKGQSYEKQYWREYIVAINTDETIDTVTSVLIHESSANRNIEKFHNKPTYVIGNALYRLATDFTTQTDFINKYSKENNWQPVRIDFPEKDKSKPWDGGWEGNQDIHYYDAWQLKDAILIKTKYRNKKDKVESVVYLFTDK